MVMEPIPDVNREAEFLALLSEIDRALRGGDTLGASALAFNALEFAPEHSGLLNLAAYKLIQNDELDQARILLERARHIAPNDANILNSLGNVLRLEGEILEARRAFDAAMELDHTNLQIVFNRARLLEDLSENEAARAGYNRVLIARPGDVDCLTRLFHLAISENNYAEAERLGDLAIQDQSLGSVAGRLCRIAIERADYVTARNYGERALAREQGAAAAIGLAQAEYLSGDTDLARKRLEDVFTGSGLEALDRAIAHGLLGDIEHRAENYESAYSHYAECKRLLAKLYSREFSAIGSESYVDAISRLRANFESMPPELWTSAPPSEEDFESPVKAHAFLVGFPRSGTTLLEQVLAGHPNIQTMDEVDALSDSLTGYLEDPDGLRRLAHTSNQSLAKMRSSYWRKCRAATPRLNGSYFVDKMPLNSALLPCIAKIFPSARIIFAIRDPRDVAFSCFRTRFTMTPAMYEFCSVEGAARLYDAVMSSFELYRSRLWLPVFEAQYSDLVGDLESAARRLCQFLGVAFESSMLAVADRAKSMRISTPSAGQVARGLYDGTGSWRPYRSYMTPILPVLAPWVERYGFSDDESHFP